MTIDMGNGQKLQIVDSPRPPQPEFKDSDHVLISGWDEHLARTGKSRAGHMEIPASNLASGASFTRVMIGDRCVDYQNVRLAGYLSTFKSTTPADRQGDWVEPGAFRETLPRFMKNPCLLADHSNQVGRLCGRVTKAIEDTRGLYIEAEVSNGDSEFLRQTRALVAEGHLRTLSMGGLFYYGDNGSAIHKVDLYEATLTPIPANPDAIFSVQ